MRQLGSQGPRPSCGSRGASMKARNTVSRLAPADWPEEVPDGGAPGKVSLALELEPEAAVVGQVLGLGGVEVHRHLALVGLGQHLAEKRPAGALALAAGVNGQHGDEGVEI